MSSIANSLIQHGQIFLDYMLFMQEYAQTPFSEAVAAHKQTQSTRLCSI